MNKEGSNARFVGPYHHSSCHIAKLPPCLHPAANLIAATWHALQTCLVRRAARSQGRAEAVQGVIPKSVDCSVLMTSVSLDEQGLAIYSVTPPSLSHVGPARGRIGESQGAMLSPPVSDYFPSPTCGRRKHAVLQALLPKSEVASGVTCFRRPSCPCEFEGALGGESMAPVLKYLRLFFVISSPASPLCVTDSPKASATRPPGS
jgi:hypothetical protein